MSIVDHSKGEERPELEVDHSSPSSAEVKDAFTLSCVFMALCLSTRTTLALCYYNNELYTLCINLSKI